MKKLLIIICLATLCAPSAVAQTRALGPLHSVDSPREDWLLPGDTLFSASGTVVYKGKPVKATQPTTALSIIQPAHESRPAAFRSVASTDSIGPGAVWEPYAMWPWGLHRGLNLQLGLSAFITPGHDAPHSGGFTQSLSAAYLTPVTKDGRLWMLAGAQMNNINWGSDNYRDAGLYAMVGYRFNEHWQAYAYGRLSLADNYSSYYNRYYGCGLMPYGAYMPWFSSMNYGLGSMAPGANTVGAGVVYSPNHNISIGIEVQGAWYNNDHTPRYNRQYDYPVPEVR